MWTEAPLAGFDLETTGPDPRTARIVTGCTLAVDGATIVPRTWLVDPEIEIPQGATDVHGISTERARAEGQDYGTGYREIRDELERLWAMGRIIAIYNASYDLTVMDTEGRRLGYGPLVPGPVVDPFVIDREVDKYRRGKRTLTVTCEHYGITLDNAHAADGDALAAARLAWVLGRRYQGLASLRVEELMTTQADWHRARQDDYAAYLTRKGEDPSGVCGDWPVRVSA
uniref:3'-5' exonuclease n=1 Tax=Micromonospora sp. NBC_00855 TaxID=2975978 RepID=UPI002255E5C1|nr:3'-5' exonuclease [Micromonospora sp. NBC_00855]